MVSQIEWPIFSATTANDRSLIYRDSGIGRKITHAPFYTSNVYMCVSVSVLHIYVVSICTASSGTLAKLWKLFRGIGNCQRSLFLRAAQSAIYDAFPLAQRWSSFYSILYILAWDVFVSREQHARFINPDDPPCPASAALLLFFHVYISFMRPDWCFGSNKNTTREWNSEIAPPPLCSTAR